MTEAERNRQMEALIQATARRVAYPPTPPLRQMVGAKLARTDSDLAQPPRVRRWAAALAVLLVAVGGLLGSVPQVRAGLGEWLHVGAVRIQLGGTRHVPPTPHAPLPPDLVSWQELDGATTLQAAAATVDFEVVLPTYPVGIGLPDRVFVQELGAPSIVLLWLAEDDQTVDLALFEFGNGAVVHKVQPRTLQEVMVRGRHGVWATGPYLVVLGNDTVEIRRLTEGNVLIWEEAGVTYRLETRAGMEEAIRSAESLVPYPGS